jgi:cysteine desulfurase / selenocysteine lyase
MTLRTPQLSSSAVCSWEQFRQSMPVTDRWAYFDHAAVAPLPSQTREEIVRWLKDASENGDAYWLNWATRIEEIRKLAATLINAMPQEIAFVSNTTEAIGFVAEGFPWKPGDNVVMPAGEFPSNALPWQHLQSRGVEVRCIRGENGNVDLSALDQACDERTRIVTLSWVGYANGFRVDPAQAAEIAHRHGALLFLDAIQGIGVFPLDVKAAGVDFAAADGHKWMLGPEGAGIMYIKHEHLDRLRPLKVGWNSVDGRFDFSNIELQFRNEAARYEGGSQNMIGFHGLGRSLELLASLGLGPQSSSLSNRVLEVADELVEKLIACGAQVDRSSKLDHQTGIVSFALPQIEPAALRQRLYSAGVVTSVRHGKNRASLHAYNNSNDIDRLIDALPVMHE